MSGMCPLWRKGVLRVFFEMKDQGLNDPLHVAAT